MEIEKTVEKADAVIVCLSKNSVSREGYVQRELRYVLDISDYKPEGTIFVIPLRLDDCQVPRRLKNWQFVDFFPESIQNKSYERVIKTLELRKPKLEHSIVDHKKKYREKLAKRRADVIDFIKNRGKVDLHAVAEQLGIPGYSAYRLLYSLENKGVIKCRYDSDAVGHYSIKVVE